MRCAQLFTRRTFQREIWQVDDGFFPHLVQGHSVQRYKLTAFVLSAALAGLAGSLKALVVQFATLADVSWQMSGEVILMTLLGGIGTVLGPAVGAAILVVMQNYLATSDFPVTIVTGVVFMACVLMFRRGIVGEILTRWKGGR